MFFKKIFWVLFSTFPIFIYFYLVLNSKESNKSKQKKSLTLDLKIASFISAFFSVILIVLIKNLWFPGLFSLKIRETWSMTVFISFIEAGLLEELCKNSFLYLFLKKIFFNQTIHQGFSFGLLSGLFFGVIENIVYAFAFSSELSFLENSRMLLQRSYTAVIAHAFMNGTFSYLILKRVSFYLAIFVVILMHGIYDFLALPNSMLGFILVKIWLLVGIASLAWMHQNSKAH